MTDGSLTLTMTKLICHPEGTQRSKDLFKAKSIDLYVAMNLSDLYELFIDETSWVTDGSLTLTMT